MVRFCDRDRDCWRIPPENPDTQDWEDVELSEPTPGGKLRVGVFFDDIDEDSAIGAVWRDGRKWKCNVDGYREIYTTKTKAQAKLLCETMIKLFDREHFDPWNN